MAGDWIKMRGNLWDDPRVAALVDMTDTSEAAVVGSLYWLWSTADQHTEDGLMPGLTLRQIDRKTGVAGLGKALCEIGWLAETSEGVCLQKFTEHNGASAKRRATEAQRKASTRKVSASDADNIPQSDGQAQDESRQVAELEKEKEKEKEKRRDREESINSVANATVGQAAKLTEPVDIIFGYGLSMLVNAGTPEKQARSFLGCLRKAHGDEALIDKLRECAKAKALQPLEWLAAALPPHGGRRRSTHSGFDQLDYSEGIDENGRIIL